MKNKKLIPYVNTLKDIGPILFRHIFVLVNAVIFAVVVLLVIFGNITIAIFLGAITIFNIFLGIIQDTRARIALEQLQMITALRVTRINASDEHEDVYMDEVRSGDVLILKLGDQVPCDALLTSSDHFEISESLITGESEPISKRKGDIIQAGSIVVSGKATVETTQSYAESTIARMTEEAKKYSINPSPIEHAVHLVIRYAGYALVMAVVLVIIRGVLVGQSYVDMVLNIGAIASMIVPQGLIVITTLLFAFGAASYSKKHVLFQEINATEKLGRINNLCMDKTGTLTDNSLQVEQVHLYGATEETYISNLMSLYIKGSGDTSQTIAAVKAYVGGPDDTYEISSSIPFSSWRQFGAVLYQRESTHGAVYVGSADALVHHFKNTQEIDWLDQITRQYRNTGKRMLCIAHTDSFIASNDLDSDKIELHPLGIYVFESGFRHGVEQAITFFQNRGVRVRIISGDHLDTVRSIAETAGIREAEKCITGPQMNEWTSVDYEEKTKNFTIFARIMPEQKVHIIEALKKDGFTAMIGDGANDALAIKKSDLGIAMFDGVPATRRLAGIVLMNNSFNDLPGGVELADNFIRNIAILASVFISSSFVGFLFFILISLINHVYPISPLNITFTNYFVVGIPGMLVGYWAIRPTARIIATNSSRFLSHIMPFIVWSGVFQAIALFLVYLISPDFQTNALSSMSVVIALIFSGYIFFCFAPRVYRGNISRSERLHLVILALFEVLLFYVIIHISPLVTFFNLHSLPPTSVWMNIGFIYFGYAIVQYLIARRFNHRNDIIDIL